MMTAAKLLRLLLELDQQCISPRPSLFGEGAELVTWLAMHAEESRRGVQLDDWRSVDLSQVRQRAPRELNQPILDAMDTAGEQNAAIAEAAADPAVRHALVRERDELARLLREHHGAGRDGQWARGVAAITRLLDLIEGKETT